MEKSRSDQSKDLFLVDCGIENLRDVYLDLPELRSLNLHSNYIQRIENLSALTQLTHLDLSSNKICQMQGLDYLLQLRQLNLACNEITMVKGLSTLRCLCSINLSFNKIVDVIGFRHMAKDNSLACVQLQGNDLSDINDVIAAFKSCSHLTCLVLEDGQSATNPLCRKSNYAEVLKDKLKNLKSMDKSDADESVQSFEGSLEETSDEQLRPQIAMKETPRIDQVLNPFKKTLDAAAFPKSDISSSADLMKEDSVADPEKLVLEKRLADLEKELLQKRIQRLEADLSGLQQKNRVVSETSEASESAEECKDRPEPKNSAMGPSQKKVLKSNSQHALPNAIRKKPSQPGDTKQATVGQSMVASERARAARPTDADQREAISATYHRLIKDLADERERRFKAEEAITRLLQENSSMKASVQESDLAKRNCDDALQKLKRTLEDLQVSNRCLTEESGTLKGRCKEAEAKLAECRRKSSDQEKTISQMEAAQRKMVSTRQTYEQRHLAERESLHAALEEQKANLLSAHNSLKNLRTELEEMRALLAAREAEHRRDMECRYTLDSPKLEELFTAKVTSLVRNHEQERLQLESKLSQAQQSYAELEDEFRMALHIEADRFNSVTAAFEAASSELAEQKQITALLNEKDIKSIKIVSDLTQLVKEQKEKILSLSKERQDTSTKHQQQLSKLESQISNLSKEVANIPQLKKDNIELKNQVQGQHSVITGLRKERELWGKELAQQGAALSSERGCLEAKIESLTLENKTLRSNLDSEVDSVKIKAAVIADLSDSISQLKKKLNEADSQTQSHVKELQEVKDTMGKLLDAEREHSAELDRTIDCLEKRKEELKSRLAHTEAELTQCQESHKTLKAKWQDRSSAISSMEQRVKQITDTWKEKEENLITERDQALSATDACNKKLRAVDDAFRKQLEAKELSHANQIETITSQYELRLAEEQQKIEEVEQEMRELLKEKEITRKGFEERLRKVSQAFMDLQQDMS